MSNSTAVTSAESTFHEEHASLILKALQSVDDPQSLSQILKLIPKAASPPAKEAIAAIEHLVRSGTVHAYPEVRGKPLYWHRSPKELARRQLIRRAERGPLLQSEIIGAVSRLKTLQELSKNQVCSLFSELVNEGRIYKLPPYLGARTPLYSVSPVEPGDYLRDALKKLSAKLGVSERMLLESYLPAEFSLRQDEQVPASGAGAAEDHRILEAMRDPSLDPRQEGMITIAKLRNALSLHLEGEEFDRAILRESAAGRIALHRFDRAMHLSEEERQRNLVRDADGNYYNCVSIRNQA